MKWISTLEKKVRFYICRTVNGLLRLWVYTLDTTFLFCPIVLTRIEYTLQTNEILLNDASFVFVIRTFEVWQYTNKSRCTEFCGVCVCVIVCDTLNYVIFCRASLSVNPYFAYRLPKRLIATNRIDTKPNAIGFICRRFSLPLFWLYRCTPSL